MASVDWGHSGDRPLPALVEAAAADEPLRPNGRADPYEGTVKRLFALLEENQIAIATLAQAWQHQSRELEVTRAELVHTQEALAAERRAYRKTAG